MVQVTPVVAEVQEIWVLLSFHPYGSTACGPMGVARGLRPVLRNQFCVLEAEPATVSPTQPSVALRRRSKVCP